MHTTEWGLLIVNYLFLGGLSAGLFFVSAFAAYLMDRDENSYGRIAKYGAIMAPWPVATGSLLLIFDLGQWHRFYKLFLTFQWQSPMSIGSWLLVLFNIIAVVNCWFWLEPEQRAAVGSKLRLPAWFRREWPGARKTLAAAGFPLSLGVAIYTGVLLGAVQARPFWNTNLVAQMFLFSALSTGCATLILALSYGRESLNSAQIRFLYTLDICLICLEFFVVLPYLIHGQLSVEAVRHSLELILGGPYTLVFWLFFLGMGLLVPLAMEVREVLPALKSGAALHHNRKLSVTAAVLVVAGGYILRYVFVYAGQDSTFR